MVIVVVVGYNSDHDDHDYIMVGHHIRFGVANRKTLFDGILRYQFFPIDRVIVRGKTADKAFDFNKLASQDLRNLNDL